VYNLSIHVRKEKESTLPEMDIRPNANDADKE
jgi:hypothetical protein